MPREVESASYPIFLDHLAGFVQFSPETMVIAAGNAPEHSAIAHMISTPLASRFKIIKVQPPTINDWRRWMDAHYNGNWDHRVYAFLLAFRDENYFMQPPKRRETLDPYPVPRTWTWLALELHEGFDSPDDIDGYVGAEVGAKFRAFLKTRVNIDELVAAPRKFHELDFDAKYMAAIMLASWLSKHAKTMQKAFPLIDEMTSERTEFLVITCTSMKRNKLLKFLEQLIKYQPEYRKILSEVALGLRDAIAV